jgi:hypothetical protein
MMQPILIKGQKSDKLAQGSTKVPIKVYAYVTKLFLDVQEHWLLGPEILINESRFHFMTDC